MIPKKSLFELARALEGVAIVGCLRGTPTALAGVRYGDILISVNGMRTRTFGDYLEAKALREDGMSIVLFRAGEEQKIEIEYRSEREPVDHLSLVAELVSMRVLPGDGEGNA